MLIKLIGNVIKEGDYHWFYMIGWIDQSGNPNASFEKCPTGNNTNIRPKAYVGIEEKIKVHINPNNLFVCDYDRDNPKFKIKSLNELKDISDTYYPFINGSNLLCELDGLQFVNNDAAIKLMNEHHLPCMLIQGKKNSDTNRYYGVFSKDSSELNIMNIRGKESIFTHGDKNSNIRFIPRSQLSTVPITIDCSSSVELKTWFKNKYDLNIHRFIDEGPEGTHLDVIRWKRVKNLCQNFFQLDQELLEFFDRNKDTSFGKRIVSVAKEALKESLVQELSNKDALFAAMQNQKNSLQSEINKKNIERDNLTTQISEKTNEINQKKIDITNKNTEIEELDKKALSIQNQLSSINEEIRKKRIELATTFERVKNEYSDTINDLKTILSSNNESCSSNTYQIQPYVANNSFSASEKNAYKKAYNTFGQASFIPSTAVAYACAGILEHCEVFCLHVEHDWLHYSDFIDHGLLQAWVRACEHPEIDVIIVLDSINLTHPECGLKPLIDVINKESPVLTNDPKQHVNFPKNLKIMATLLENDDIVLEIDFNGIFKNWNRYTIRDNEIQHLKYSDPSTCFDYIQACTQG